MPVIGRLDEQVDEVLIRPASRRGRARTSGESAGQTGDEELTRPPTPEDSKSPAPPSDDDTPEGVDEDAREELPVWLL
ncbi:MAG TPA: hypothetical protein VFX96_18575 [Pyrinomonadaceae bacterium]|nr:hypothetical protein [Pyrinomonadaceae bacterium]